MIFCIKISLKVFYKLIPFFLVAIASHAKSTQNNKFVLYLQYLKERRSKVDFLQVDKYQIFLQGDSINFSGHSQSCPKSSNYQNICKIFPMY